MRVKLSRASKWLLAVAVVLFLLAICRVALIGSRGSVFVYWASKSVCLRCGQLTTTSDLQLLGRSVRAKRESELTAVGRILYSAELDSSHHEFRFSESRGMNLEFPSGFTRQSSKGPPGHSSANRLAENKTLIHAISHLAFEDLGKARNAWYWLCDKVDSGKWPEEVQLSLDTDDEEGLLKLLRQGDSNARGKWARKHSLAKTCQGCSKIHEVFSFPSFSCQERMKIPGETE